MTLWALPEMGGSKTALSRLSDLAADRPESSGQLKMISPTLARWRWAYLGSAMLKPAKSLIKHKRF